MELKNSELLVLQAVINVYKKTTNGDIAWGLMRNTQRISNALKDYLDLKKEREAEIAELFSEGKPLHEYDEKRVELCKKRALKDEKGKPVQSGNSFVIEDQVAFDKDLKKLGKPWEKELEERDAIQKVITDSLEKKVEFTPYQMDPELVRKANLISMEHMLYLAERGIIENEDADEASPPEEEKKVTPLPTKKNRK